MAAGLRAAVAIAVVIGLVLAIGVAARSPVGVASAPVATLPSRGPQPAPPPASPPARDACRSSERDTVSPGVTTTAIRVASTVTLDGPGASLLDEAAVGMRAVVHRANRAGGICGRRIELTTVNDSWIRANSHALLRRFIEEDYFALVGMPGSDGLVEAIEQGDVHEAAIPVVGTSGMADAEFTSPWVWPVGTSTAAIMRHIAEDARQRDAWRFALVRDGVHQFGHDGAAAFRDQVGRLGGRVVADIAVDPADADLTDEARAFDAACGGTVRRCDAVVLLLAPSTALAWRDASPAGGRGGPRHGRLIYGAHTLSGDAFAVACGQWCDGMTVFSPYGPAISDGDAALTAYVRSVRAERADIDVRGLAAQHGYVAMTVFSEAARRCSPDLTRECLRQVLDTATFDTGLTAPLRWHGGDRHASTAVHASVIRVTGARSRLSAPGGD